MNRFVKAAAFGAMMGKRAAFTVANPTERRLIGGAAGALVGGLGTAGYDWLMGTKEHKLRRALMGAGLGGLTGVGIGHLTNSIDPSGPKASSPKKQTLAEDPISDTAPAEDSKIETAPVDGRLVPVKSHFTPEDFRRGSEFPYGFDFNEYNVGQANRRYAKAVAKHESAIMNLPIFFGRAAARDAELAASAERSSAHADFLNQKYPSISGLSKDGPRTSYDDTIYNPITRSD
jgi:hypothetical protein